MTELCDKINYTLTQKLLRIGDEKVTDWRSLKNNNKVNEIRFDKPAFCEVKFEV